MGHMLGMIIMSNMKKLMSLMILLFTLFSLGCESNIDIGKSTSKLTSSATTDAGYVGITVSWTDSGVKQELHLW